MWYRWYSIVKYRDEKKMTMRKKNNNHDMSPENINDYNTMALWDI